MSLTIELLRFLGSPFAHSTIYLLNQSRSVQLHEYSVKNRMLFFYLQTISKKSLRDFAIFYQKERTKYLKTINAVSRASQVLTNENIRHAIFKTVRPYESTTVDIDILIFGDKNNYIRSIKAMQSAGYKLIVRGPRSTTFHDSKINIGIDLYEQVAVSYLTYIDKERLVDYVTTTRLPNGEPVKTLKPEADLIAIIAHSIIKEQMYTLSEYYTFIHYLKQMNIHNFIQTVKQNNLTSATRTHAALTALLHKAAHNTTPSELQQILNNLGEEKFETTRLIKNNFKTPHKYHPITVAKSLLEITKGKKTRNSMATQIYHMLNPNFSKKFLKASMVHVIRETY